MHPAKDGFAALPFFDEFDLSTVDILLLSQYVLLHPPRHSPRVYWTFLLVFYFGQAKIPSVFEQGDLRLIVSISLGGATTRMSAWCISEMNAFYMSLAPTSRFVHFVYLNQRNSHAQHLSRVSAQISIQANLTYPLQFPRRPLVCSPIRAQQDQFQRSSFDNTRYQGHL